MAVSFRVGVTFTASPSNPQTINPGTDPATDGILILPAGVSSDFGGGAFASSLGSDSFGGTWTEEHNQVWGSRRRLQVWANDDWTTASGSVAVSFSANQDTATGLLIVEGADTYTEDATAGDASGSDWTPTLTAGHSGHVVIIQMEDNVTIGTPAGWTQHANVTATSGLRVVAVFSIVGQPPDLTPTFTFGGSNGYTGWSAYFDAAAGATTSTPPVRRIDRFRPLLVR